MHTSFLSDAEREESYYHRGNNFEFYTSNDPTKIGVHIVPLFLLHDENKHHLLVADMFIFTFLWCDQYSDKLNGFMSPNPNKYIFHECGWKPVKGYDKNIINFNLL